ncbi:regulatory particle non-ATPase [Rhodotorula kratochvilovae]
MGNQEASQLYSHLKLEWAKGDSLDRDQVRSLLARLKIELSELGLLFPDSSTLDTGALTTAREVLELGALFSVRTDDIPSFERYLSLLSPYYADLSSTLPASENEAPLIALSLLRLLSQNRIAEFHTVLETLEGKKVVDSKEVAWVMQLERSLMEGSYSRVWSLCRPSPSTSSSSALPLPEFAHLTPPLLATVRAEIAACDERAYESLPLRDAKTLLFFETEDEVKAFAAERNWHLDPSTQTLHFPSSRSHPSNLPSSSSSAAARVASGIPAGMATGSGLPLDAPAAEGGRELDRSAVVTAALKYARELESIV